MMLTRSIVVGSLLIFSVPAVAQPAVVPSLSDTVPRPNEEDEVSGYRILAIVAGGVAGVMVANMLTGGMITPILLAATGEASAPVVAAAAPEVVAAAPAAAATVAEMVAAVPVAAATVAAPMMAGVSYTYMAAQAGVMIVGGAVGGYVGNWLYDSL